MTADPLDSLELGQRVRIDVLVDDVKPSGERPSLVQRLRSLQPELRLVRVLGPEDQFPEPDGGVLLRRPFSLDELENAIAEALKSEPSMDEALKPSSGGRGFAVQLVDQLPDQLLDLGSDLPHLLEGQRFRV